MWLYEDGIEQPVVTWGHHAREASQLRTLAATGAPVIGMIASAVSGAIMGSLITLVICSLVH